MGLGTGIALRSGHRALDDELGQRLIAVAQAAGTLVPGQRALRLEAGDEESRLYRSLQAKLVALQSRTSVRSVVVFDREGRALVDDASKHAVRSELIKLRFDRAELERVFAGQSAASVLFDDEDGRRYKTGYAPLTDDEGQIVGGIAVDGSAEIFAELDELRRALLGLGLLGLLAVTLISLAVSRRLVRPLVELVGFSGAISRGDLLREPQVTGKGETAVLAKAMTEMRDAIVQRDEEMQLMLAGVAHEVRNPLGGIELYAGLLADQVADDARATRRVKRIQRELHQLANIVEDFLHFARRRELAPEPLELAPLLEESADLLRNEAEEKGVALKLEIDAAPTLKADATSLKRAVLNLVKNAVQATPAEGSVTLRALPDGDGAKIEIRDTGSGIPPEKLESIFRPFFTTKEKGSGLGLPLVRKIVDSHGGRLDVSSEVDRGTTVHLWLPHTPPANPSPES